MLFLTIQDILLMHDVLITRFGGSSGLRDRAGLEAALMRLIDSPGPALLDVQVPYQEQVLPMIPSGGTVRDLIKR